MDEMRVLSAVLHEIDGTTFDSLEGRVAFQKRIYLAQEAGLPLGYGFTWNQFGPFSEDLAEDGRRLELAESIWQGSKPPLTVEARAIVERYRTVVGSKPPGIREGAWLELLASMHYLRRRGVGEERSLERIKARLQRLKPYLNVRDEAFDEAWKRTKLLLEDSETLPATA